MVVGILNPMEVGRRLRGAACVARWCAYYAAMHRLCCATPVTSRCTRYVALHPNRRGVLPTDRV